ncbi:hypothetical protein DZ858_12600 [Marixanthomonas ophiurae]|uniref:Uncharacterized protein n=1 Tax=Marixanthomonas ophiurae TaxID=387659 RepID=A0A3E1Q7H5_9FLAO|nr:hypothetical protein DZ858_12600 [Marixanthomonas ophiurae]
MFVKFILKDSEFQQFVFCVVTRSYRDHPTEGFRLNFIIPFILASSLKGVQNYCFSFDNQSVLKRKW